MKIYLLFLSCLAWYMPTSSAQKGAVTVSGTVADSAHSPVESANVLLLRAKDLVLVKAVFTEADGAFIIDHIMPGKYLAAVQALGYKKYYSPVFDIKEGIAAQKIDPIVLPETGHTMEEIKIVSTRPFMEKLPGKTVINVENSVISTGGTALDVLKRSPGVQVDITGNISLEGKQDVLVLIDGKPTYLSGEQLANLLTSTGSDQVSKVELMTSPPAKYDASGNGGIINIILKKSKMYGFAGAISANYGQGMYPKGESSINFNYRNEQINIFGNFGHYFNKAFVDFDFIKKRNSGPAADSVFNSTSHKTANSAIYSGMMGADWFIHKNHTVGFSVRGNERYYNGAILENTNISSVNNALLSRLSTQSDLNKNWNRVSGNLNYSGTLDTSGTMLTSDFDYMLLNSTPNQYFITRTYSNTGALVGQPSAFRSDVPLIIKIFSAKADYTTTILKKVQIETGIKTSLVKIDNNSRYFNIVNGTETQDITSTNHFEYSENINAAYIDVSRQFSKLSVKAGLRAEQTMATGRQFANDSMLTINNIKLFPTLFLTYKFNEKNQLDLAYNRRIDRPDYSRLNPFRYYFDPYTYETGNPFLKPENTDDMSLTYTWMNRISTSIDYARTTDVIARIQIDSGKQTYATYLNLNLMERYGIGVNFINVPVTRWWTSNTSMRLARLIYYNLNSNISFSFNCFNQFEIGKGFTAELDMQYNSANYLGIYLFLPTYSINGGLHKKLNDRLRVGLDFNTFWADSHYTNHVVIAYKNFDLDLQERVDCNIVWFNLSYTFGKTTVKSPDPHRPAGNDAINRAGGIAR